MAKRYVISDQCKTINEWVDASGNDDHGRDASMDRPLFKKPVSMVYDEDDQKAASKAADEATDKAVQKNTPKAHAYAAKQHTYAAKVATAVGKDQVAASHLDQEGHHLHAAGNLSNNKWFADGKRRGA